MSLFVISVALAQVAPEEPAIVVPLTAWVAPADVDAMRFLQDGRALGGRLVYDERALEVVFYTDGPLSTRAPVAFDFPAIVSDVVSPYGPFYDPNLPLAAAPRCDYGLDRDEDGLPDCAERPDQMYWGHWLYDYGARIGPRDWFVRIGWMANENEGQPDETDRPWTRPFPEALEKVEGALLDAGITVHFDVGLLYTGPGYAPKYHAAYNLSYTHHDRPFGPAGWATPSVNCEQDYVCGNTPFIDGWKGGNTFFLTQYHQALLEPSDDRVFSFVMFANDSSGGVTGVAQFEGANAVISVSGGDDGDFEVIPGATLTWKPRTEQEKFNKIVNYQSGTLLHEMGHLLGLREGGADTLASKPNHVSSMSYYYQITGLPHDGADAEERYYSRKGGTCPAEPASTLVHGPLGDPADFRIGYSVGDETPLDEHALDEAIGFSSVAADIEPFAVDWDCDTPPMIEIGVTKDLSGTLLVLSNDPHACVSPQPGPTATDVLVPSNDVATIELYHRRWFGQPLPNDGLPFACPL